MSPYTFEDRSLILLPRSFARLLKAERRIEAECLLMDALDSPNIDDRDRIQYISIVIDSMRQRRAFKNCYHFISTLAIYFQNKRRKVQETICRLCISDFNANGPDALKDAESLLINCILARLKRRWNQPQEHSAVILG